MKLKKALLIVDVQNDFCPGGALGVSRGHKIAPTINKYIKIFSKKKLHDSEEAIKKIVKMGGKKITLKNIRDIL